MGRKKRPKSEAADSGPTHVRVGQHGVRTTAQTFEERREAAFKEAQAEGVSEEVKERKSEAGPNPYKGKKAGTAHEEAQAESDATDAEIAIPGETLTDTGAKIVLEPERVGADEKAELPKAGNPTEEAEKTLDEEPESHGEIEPERKGEQDEEPDQDRPDPATGTGETQEQPAR